MPRKVLFVLSDIHAGFKYGLMSPDTVLFDENETGEMVGYHPKLSENQRYLWGLYQDCIQQVKQLAGADGLVGIVNGDLTQGDKYASMLVSSRRSDQVVIAETALAEWYALPGLQALRVMIGTEAHNMGEGASELAIAERLRQRYPQVDTAAAYHSLITIDGVTVDAAHHGPYPGSREWLRGNVARYYLRDLMNRSIQHGETPPQLVLRAHYHEYVHEELWINGFHSVLIVTPSFAMLGDHAHQAARSPFEVTNGMVAFEIVDGEITKIHELMKTVDIRRREVL